MTGMMTMRRWILLWAVALAALTGCTAVPRTAPAPSESPAPRVYALVVKDIVNPYMLTMFNGFQAACQELGVEAVLSGPEIASADEQAKIIMELAEQRVDAIAVAANDREALSEPLAYAISRGVRVVSLDSAVNAKGRMLHIQQASPEMIGRALMQASRLTAYGSGAYAILTTTKSAPNQASWVAWMLREVEENPEKYGGMTIAEIAYGQDDLKISMERTRELLRAYPSLKLIIAPTSVGMRAAAEVITEQNADTKLIGLGLPSEMEPYIRSGVCPLMYLWNPVDMGYLAAYAADALVRGDITGAVGERFRAGSLGDKLITLGEDGGSEVVLGNPAVFDLNNIAVWSEVF